MERNEKLIAAYCQWLDELAKLCETVTGIELNQLFNVYLGYGYDFAELFIDGLTPKESMLSAMDTLCSRWELKIKQETDIA